MSTRHKRVARKARAGGVLEFSPELVPLLKQLPAVTIDGRSYGELVDGRIMHIPPARNDWRIVNGRVERT